jgi:antitoxin component YwqK of YwqJK toxin-antitoxin module
MNEVDLDDLQTSVDGEVPVFRLRGTLYSGRVNERRGAKLASSFLVRDGYKHGEELLFASSGELEGRLHYADGVASGKVEYFHPGGSPKEQASFELGICLASTSYDTTGAVIRQYELAKDSFEFRQLERLRRRVRGA